MRSENATFIIGRLRQATRQRPASKKATKQTPSLAISDKETSHTDSNSSRETERRHPTNPSKTSIKPTRHSTIVDDVSMTNRWPLPLLRLSRITCVYPGRYLDNKAIVLHSGCIFFLFRCVSDAFY